MSTNALTVPLNPALKQRLERLAADTHRFEAELAAQAIEAFLAVQDWQADGIEKAKASIDRGEDIPHEKVVDWVQSWGTEDEKPAPRR